VGDVGTGQEGKRGCKRKQTKAEKGETLQGRGKQDIKYIPLMVVLDRPTSTVVDSSSEMAALNSGVAKIKRPVPPSEEAKMGTSCKRIRTLKAFFFSPDF